MNQEISYVEIDVSYCLLMNVSMNPVYTIMTDDDDDGDNEHSSFDGGDEHHKSTEIRDTPPISDNYVTRFGRTVRKPVRYDDTN